MRTKTNLFFCLRNHSRLNQPIKHEVETGKREEKEREGGRKESRERKEGENEQGLKNRKNQKKKSKMRYETKNYTIKAKIDDLCFFGRTHKMKKKTIRQILKEDVHYITWAIKNLENVEWSSEIIDEHDRLIKEKKEKGEQVKKEKAEKKFKKQPTIKKINNVERLVLGLRDNYYQPKHCWNEPDFKISVKEMIDRYPETVFKELIIGPSKKMLQFDIAQSLFRQVMKTNSGLVDEFRRMTASKKK